MTGSVVAKTIREVKPLVSVNSSEARRRVLQLYKAWFRQLPHIVSTYDIPKSVAACKAVLRSEFYKHKDLDDIRIIDMLVIKGQMELREMSSHWKQNNHVMAFFKDTMQEKPSGFMAKFLQNVD